MKHTYIALSIALLATVVSAAEPDTASIGCGGASQITVSGRIDAVAMQGLPPVDTVDTVDTANAPTAVVPAAVVPLAPASQMITDATLYGMPSTSTVGDAGAPAATWDFKANCVDYTEKFWQWRVSKCLAADATWVSPGLGNKLPGK